MIKIHLPTFRSFHLWIGALLGLPLFLVATTAIFIAHEKALNLDKIPVSIAWLPGYNNASGEEHRPEVKAYISLENGAYALGTKAGVIEFGASGQNSSYTLAGVDVRALAKSPQGDLFAASKRGLYHRAKNAKDWQRLAGGDFHYVGYGGGRIVVAEKGRGLLYSEDGGVTWSSDEAIMTALGGLARRMGPEQKTLKNLVNDIHTGKAFFGKSAKWIWIDILGVSIMGLALTGVILWARRRRRQDTLTP